MHGERKRRGRRTQSERERGDETMEKPSKRKTKKEKMASAVSRGEATHPFREGQKSTKIQGREMQTKGKTPKQKAEQKELERHQQGGV